MKKRLVALLSEIAETTIIESNEDDTCAFLIIELYQNGLSKLDFNSTKEAEEFRDYLIAWLRGIMEGMK